MKGLNLSRLRLAPVSLRQNGSPSKLNSQKMDLVEVKGWDLSRLRLTPVSLRQNGYSE